MGRSNNVDTGLQGIDDDEFLGFIPKRRLAAATISLGITVAGVLTETLFKVALNVFTSIFAVVTVIFIIFGLVAFLGAIEHREKQHSLKQNHLISEIKRMGIAYDKQCAECNINWQNLLVSTSEKLTKELAEQKQFYEDYITAVLVLFYGAVDRLQTADSIIPIIDGLKGFGNVPDIETKNEELMQWKTLITGISQKVKDSRSNLPKSHNE